MNIKDKLLDIQYSIENWYNAKQMTVIEMLVLVVLLCFLVVQSAEAKTKKHKQPIPTNSMSIIHVDLEKDSIIKGQNIEQVRALASITKLMTAVVALDYSTEMDKVLTLSSKAGSKLPKREYTRGQLFHAMLIKSDNAAAETIAADYPGGREKFISDMNIRAMMLQMYSTTFDDPSGLSSHNVSTASDVTQMVVAASKFGEIRDISTKKTATIDISSTKRSRVTILHNTNTAILSQVQGVQVSKTGFTNPAGFCVAILVHKQNGDKEYHEVIVVMGARNPSQRVDTVKKVSYNGVIGDNYVTSKRI